MAQKGYKKRTRRSSRKTRKQRRTIRKRFCIGRRRYQGGTCPCSVRSNNSRGLMKGGNYATDVTTAEFQGFPYKNEKSTVVAFPGTPGVMDLKDYKKMMEDEDREGYDPTA